HLSGIFTQKLRQRADTRPDLDHGAVIADDRAAGDLFHDARIDQEVLPIALLCRHPMTLQDRLCLRGCRDHMSHENPPSLSTFFTSSACTPSMLSRRSSVLAFGLPR